MVPEALEQIGTGVSLLVQKKQGQNQLVTSFDMYEMDNFVP
jgi:hypothetical protein